VSRKCSSPTRAISSGPRRSVRPRLHASAPLACRANSGSSCTLQWYADRGIPFRRGFLLFGVPGSGKTSLIHAIAGELSLDIYVVSLSASWMTDSTLTTLMGRVPARCILLLEDLDAAFTRSVTRDNSSTGTPNKNGGSGSGGVVQGPQNNNSNNNGSGNNSDNISDLNTLSLSGLLNAIDGVAAAEGRLLFATTNHLERLDPALSRPGRMDVWVEFKVCFISAAMEIKTDELWQNATKWQAEQLFRNFFPCATDPVASGASSGSVSDVDADDEATDAELRAAGVSALRFEATPLGPDGARFDTAPTSPTSPRPKLNTPFGPDGTALTAAAAAAAFHPASYPPSPPSSASPIVPPSPARSARSAPLTEEEAAARLKAIGPVHFPLPAQNLLDYGGGPTQLDPARLAQLASQFATSIPNEEFSVAALQGYLLKNKSRPEAAASEAAGWVASERELRERLAREKEEKERKERERKAEEREKRRREEEERVRERLERERVEREKMDKEREQKVKTEQEKMDKEKDQAPAIAEAKPAEVVAAPLTPAPSETSTPKPEVVSANDALGPATLTVAV